MVDGPVALPVIHALRGSPTYVILVESDGRPCPVWRNPSLKSFAKAIRTKTTDTLEGLRGVLTQKDLYVWQSNTLPHAAFERQSGISGLRLRPRSTLYIHEEIIVHPEPYSWMYVYLEAFLEKDMVDRRAEVIDMLRMNHRMRAVYPIGFQVAWYS